MNQPTDVFGGARSPAARDDVVPRLERLLSRLERRRSVHHAVVGAAALDGSWQWANAAGSADPAGRPMTVDTPWLIASVTKLYIAVVVLRLVERGDLDLDEPIAAHLPSDLQQGLHVLDGVDRTGELTARHLLAHSSGLPDSIDERPRGRRSLVEDVAERDRSWTLEEAVAHAREHLSPHFPPADPTAIKPRLRYSETNFQLLVIIAQQLTGRSIQALYREWLFEPFDLRQTWLPGDETPADVPVPATVWLGEQPLEDRPQALRSFGDLYATVDDLLRFGRLLFSGAIFADPDTRRLMDQQFNRFGVPRGAAALRAPSWPIEYGLGMMRFELSRALAGGWRIPGVIGHTGSSGSWLWYCPALRIVLAGTVDQAAAATVPFRAVPRALAGLPRTKG